MKHTNIKLGIPGICLMLCALASGLAGVAAAQAFGTTTVQGTVYLANGKPGSGTLQLSWPAFNTAANQAVTAGRTTVSIGSDGFVSVNLAPNLGSMPAGLYYTAVYHLSDGTTSTEYWVVPAAAQAAIAQVRATVVPAAQAVQAVNKAYVDQSIAQLVQSQVTSSGGNMTGPLYLNGDPATPAQAASKHYVDNQFSQTLSINGGAATGPLTATQLGAAYQADQFQGADFGAKVQACVNALNSTYGGSCDARNFSGTLSVGSNVTISKANVTVNLPCATIATSSQIIVTAGTRNVTLHGCASRGTTAASGNQGGTVFLYSGSGAMIQVGDSTYASDTLGFHLDNVVLNTTSSASAMAQAVTVWRAQELHLEGLYLLGNANQTGITLDGTGNYTGGTFDDVEIGGFQTAVNAVGHQMANAATTDWVNASTFVRLHIDCPTSNGSAIAGTTGINLAQGDGNTFTGGDVESCATALHLGANAQNNTIVGLRNENSTYQVVADMGSAYNNWITGGTMFTGKLTDNGTRNSFLDTFHRSFNALNGDWFGSQQDTTLTNHYRMGIGSGNERGLLNRYQTDSGYRWTMGLSDAAAGEQYYQVLDELNNVYRLSIGQYNTGQGSSNNQTVINAAGTGAVVLNGSNSAGSGGVVFGSGGSSSSTVGTIDNAGNAQFNGALRVGGVTTFTGSSTVKNQADAEIDAFLWAGATAPQKESVTYKDWNGNSQWYMVKDASNNWALNSALGGVDSFKAYQSTNSGDTYLDAANNTGVVRVNYEPGSGSAFNVYGGGSGNLYASFNGTTGIKFPGLAAGSGHNCVQIDNSGYLSNTGVSCGSSSVGSGTTGQIAYYAGNGTTVTGMATSGALATLGGLPLAGGTLSGPLAGTSAVFSENVQAPAVALGSDQPTGHQAASANAAVTTYSVLAYGGVADAMNIPGQIGSMTAGTNVMNVSATSYTFSSRDVGKYVAINGWNNQPFSTVPWNVAKITAVNSSSQLVLNRSAVNSFTGSVVWGTDNVPAATACENAILASGHNGTCFFPAGIYLLATAPYETLLATGDDGSYGTPAGGSGAALSCSVSGGSFTGCSVTSGGSGYTANTTLQTTITGGCTSRQPECINNAWITASTNSSGVVTSATVVQPGWNFTSPPTVTVHPIGGDGAAATATRTGGTMNAPTLTAGGSGYGNGGTLNWYAFGGGCTVIAPYAGVVVPNYVAKGTVPINSGGAASGAMTVTTNAAGCTSNPTIAFGDYVCNSAASIVSPVWGQCSNLAPSGPVFLPVQIPTAAGVSWAGDSPNSGATTLLSTWDGQTVDNNQPVIFGGQVAYGNFTNLSMNGFLGIMADNNANMTNWSGLSFNGGIAIYTAETDLGFVASNINMSTMATWYNGGHWDTRLDQAALGDGGFFDASKIEYIIATTPNSYSATARAIDDWFANNLWHPEYSAYSTDFAETCKFPQTPNQRQTSMNIGAPYGGPANFACFRAPTGAGFTIASRGGQKTGDGVFTFLGLKGGYRPIFQGSFGGMNAFNFGSEQTIALTGTNDPYRNATGQEGALIINDNGSDGGNWFGSLNGVSWANGAGGVSPARNIWSISQQGDPTQTKWDNSNFSPGGQPSQNYIFSAKQNFQQGISIFKGNSSATPLGADFYYTHAGANLLAGSWEGNFTNPCSYMEELGSDGTTDVLDLGLCGVTAHEPISAPAFTLNGGTQATGTVGNGGKLQETTSAVKTSGNPVAFDANGNTTNATVANEFSLFTGCSGTMYAGYDGACHTAAGGSSPFVGHVNGTYSGVGTALGPTTIFTPGTAGPYKLCWYFDVTAAGTAGGWYLDLIYTSDGHAFNNSVSGNISSTAQWAQVLGCWKFWADSGSAINVSIPTLVTPTGTPSLRYAISLEQEQ